MSKYLLISLGHNCYVSWTFRKIGLQGPSFPLDWVNSFSFSGVFDFINDSSSSFVKQLEPCKPTSEEKDSKIMYSPKYHFRLPHEFDLDADKSLDSIAEMYKRRIERFYEKCKQADKIIFFRNIYERPYKQVPIEDLNKLDCLSDKLCKVIGERIEHENFIVVFSSYGDSLKRFTNEKCFFLNNVLPFENGFFEFDKNKLAGHALFDFKLSFFNKIFEEDFASLTDEKIRNTYLDCYMSRI